MLAAWHGGNMILPAPLGVPAAARREDVDNTKVVFVVVAISGSKKASPRSAAGSVWRLGLGVRRFCLELAVA